MGKIIGNVVCCALTLLIVFDAEGFTFCGQISPVMMQWWWFWFISFPHSHLLSGESVSLQC